jgi:uncharacterized membrane protein YoaK (UPF0700 family)
MALGANEPAGRPPSVARRAKRERRPEGARDVLVVVLTVATGATDAIGFTRLGGVFTSVMTGNIVLLGVSAGRGDGSLAMHAGLALGGYVLGTWVGTRVAGPAVDQQPVWPRPVTAALGIELVLFAAFGAWWEVADGRPSHHATYVLITINAVALGIQSGAVIRFGAQGLSTTYLTGTLTDLVAGYSRRQASLLNRSTAILLALLGGAGLGAVLTIEFPRSAPAIPLGVLVFVIAAAIRVFGPPSQVTPAGGGPSPRPQGAGGSSADNSPG